jgi:Uncharacterized protein conserved in bacteria
MEIERKFLIKELPTNLSSYPFHIIEQAYLCTEPVIRIRKQDNEFILTYKSKGFLSREEHNLPLTSEAYEHLKTKADGIVITKKRYLIPILDGLTIELDVFAKPYQDLRLAEVEFTCESAAKAFIPPLWFGEEVTYSTTYQNSSLSQPSSS